MTINWSANADQAEQEVPITREGDTWVITHDDERLTLTTFQLRHMVRRINAALAAGDREMLGRTS